MTQLKDPRGIITVKLPSFPEDEVILYEGLLTYQINELTDIEKDYDKGIGVLKKMIKSWTFLDENDKPLEISIKTLGLLPAKDFSILMDTVNETFEKVNIKKKKN